MTADPKVSPRPWRVDTNYINGAVALDDKDGCGVLFHQAAWKPKMADLAHIVRCVNAHDGLVEAVQRAYDVETSVTQGVEKVLREGYRELLRAALAAAKEGA